MTKAEHQTRRTILGRLLPRSYRVYCSFPRRGGWRARIIARNLDYVAARQLRHDLRNPGRTSWTSRLYLVELDR